MALLTSAYGTGLIIGPAVSGVIADPIGQYNLTIESESILWLSYMYIVRLVSRYVALVM